MAILTEELVRQGHAVTLFASGDSTTTATLAAPCTEALRLSKSDDPLAIHLLMVELVMQRAQTFSDEPVRCSFRSTGRSPSAWS